MPTLPHAPGAGMDDKWFMELYKGKQMVRERLSLFFNSPAVLDLLSAQAALTSLACLQVPWDAGKEQDFVVQAFEQGLFVAPVRKRAASSAHSTVLLRGPYTLSGCTGYALLIHPIVCWALSGACQLHSLLLCR